MSGSLAHSANADPNLTPILDMVFQLITFFMLVVNFKVNEIDRQMQLPIVSQARVAKDKGERLLMLNVNDKGQFTVFSKPFTDDQAKAFIEADARAAAQVIRRALKPDWKEGDELDNTLVIIRADRGTPFARISYLLKTCEDSGYRRFAFRAMTKSAGS
jgi:biopolymer transport protein ExbD